MHGRMAYVAHTGTDTYGPGYVLEVQTGELRRVRFVHFVATVSAYDLRAATADEARQVRAWRREMIRKYGRSGWPESPEEDAEPTGSRMTIRVSRDGGRTYGPVRVVAPVKGEPPRDDSSLLPPCRCPRCVERR